PCEIDPVACPESSRRPPGRAIAYQRAPDRSCARALTSEPDIGTGATPAAIAHHRGEIARHCASGRSCGRAQTSESDIGTDTWTGATTGTSGADSAGPACGAIGGCDAIGTA